MANRKIRLTLDQDEFLLLRDLIRVEYAQQNNPPALLEQLHKGMQEFRIDSANDVAD